jgi:hypothetical protein
MRNRKGGSQRWALQALAVLHARNHGGVANGRRRARKRPRGQCVVGELVDYDEESLPWRTGAIELGRRMTTFARRGMQQLIRRGQPRSYSRPRHGREQSLRPCVDGVRAGWW